MWSWLVGRKRVLWTALRTGVLLLLSAVGWIVTLGFLTSSAPVGARLLGGGMAVVATHAPRAAILILAGLAPLGMVLGIQFGATTSLNEPLALAFLAAWLSREAVRPAAVSSWTRGLLVPVALLGLVVAASSTVELAAMQPFVAYPLEFVRGLLSFLDSGYFLDLSRYEPLTVGLQFLEGLGLLAASIVLVDRTRELAGALVRVSVAGATGAAALALNRLVEVALRNGDGARAFVHHVATLRIAAAFPDVNSAGAYFAMAVLPAVGLGLAARRLRWLWFGFAAVLAFAMWLTGSRIALFALPAAAVAVGLLALRARRGLRGRYVVVASAVGVAVVAAGATLPFLLENPDRLSVSESLDNRIGLWRAGTAMAADHPWFGVGVGRFKSVSGLYLAPDLRQSIVRENAHNNFIQVGAELGLVGFVPFVWILGSVLRRMWFRMASRSFSWELAGVAGGIGAFVVTWLSGHPLLVLGVSFSFWLLLGAGGGLAATGDAGNRAEPFNRRIGKGLAVAASVLLVLASIPWRSRGAQDAADLAHASIGFSGWEDGGDGVEARWITAPKARFFVAANAAALRVPFRLVENNPAATAAISVYLDGRLANRLPLPAGSWKTMAMAMPEHARGAFHEVDVVVGDGKAVTAGIQMGRPLVIPKPAREGRLTR